MKTKYFILIVLFISVLPTSCSKEFLDTKQEGVILVDDFYKTDDQALQGLLGCYDILQSAYLSGFSYLQNLDIMSDDAYCGGSLRGDAVTLEELDEFRYSSDNARIKDMFTWFYQGVYRTNMLLSKVVDDTPNKKVIIAEAKALRAYYYFELVVDFGDVPLVLEPLLSSEYAQPRTSKSEVWAQIEKDLTEAIADLPLKSEQSTADKARISKGTAQSMLGKAYLFQEKYTEAATEFQKVIDSHEYSLYHDFSKILKVDTEWGVESVLEVSQPNNANSVNRNEAAGLAAFYSPKGAGWFSPGEDLQIWNGGFAFVNAKLALYNEYVTSGDVIRRTNTVLSEDEVIAKGAKLRNPLYATDELPQGTLAWSTDPCLRLKYAPWYSEASTIVNYSQNYGTNIRLIRYADVLLMAAEAFNRKPSPDDTKALEYINLVRSRVSLPDLTVTGDALFNAIKLERRLELAFEGHRFQDLVRWGDAATVLADEGKLIPRGNDTYYEVTGAGFKSRNMLFPIPEAEMFVNENMTQNTGY